MATKKILLKAVQVLGIIGIILVIWTGTHIVRFPLPNPASTMDIFRLCLGFGFMAIMMWAGMLLEPDKHIDPFMKVITWIVGIDGIFLVVCSFLILR